MRGISYQVHHLLRCQAGPRFSNLFRFSPWWSCSSRVLRCGSSASSPTSFPQTSSRRCSEQRSSTKCSSNSMLRTRYRPQRVTRFSNYCLAAICTRQSRGDGHHAVGGAERDAPPSRRIPAVHGSETSRLRGSRTELREAYVNLLTSFTKSARSIPPKGEASVTSAKSFGSSQLTQSGGPH